MSDELTSTEKVILSLVSNSLFDVPYEVPKDVDWEAVFEEACVQAVLPLALFRVKALLPDSISEIVNRLINKVISKNLQNEYNHEYTHSILKKAGVPYVFLKGYASAEYYPNPEYRSMGDVDFLVAKEDMEKADKILINEGFSKRTENHICHVVYQRADAHLEMHFEAPGVPEGNTGELVREYLKDIFSSSVILNIGKGQICVPDKFHHGLVLLLHTAHHLTGEGIGLRHLCDWAVFVNSFSNGEFENLFRTKLRKAGLWNFARLLTQLSVVYLGLPRQDWAMTDVDEEFLKQMIIDIFSGGNFGIKDNTRKHEAIIISSRGKNGVGNSSLQKQFIKTVNDIIYLKWPLSKKHKILLPFGWLFFGIRSGIRIITGKRERVNVTSTVSGAKKRRDIYKEFHLYETED